jgi:hypothetical protein
LRDDDIMRRRAWFASVGHRYSQLAVLADGNTPRYAVPESGPVKMEYRGLPLDLIEDLLPRSPAYRQAARILFPQPDAFKVRPLTPLHAGHVALCAVGGMITGPWRLRGELDRSTAAAHGHAREGGSARTSRFL